MGVVVSVHSFRGGTGKSNLTANLAASVARCGKRVGIIDTDIQSPGIHVILQLKMDEIQGTLNDYLWGRKTVAEIVYDISNRSFGDPTDQMRLFLIPSSIKSNEIARILREGYKVERLNDGITELIHELDLDYLFIDTHPGVNEETLLSIALSDLLVLIMRPDHQDFQGTAVTIELARRLDVPDIMLILNKIPQNAVAEPLVRKVEETYDIKVSGMLPLSGEVANLGSGSLFINAFPTHPFTVEVKRLAASIVATHPGKSRVEAG